MNHLKSPRFAALAGFYLFIASSGIARAWPPSVAGDELAVWQAAVTAVAEEQPERTIKVWYYESDFSTVTYISSAISDPDRPDYCGLSYEDAKSMFAQLKEVSTVTVVVSSEMAEAVGYRLGTKKNSRIPYVALSRVVFDKDRTRAWLSVDLNGQKGSLVRVDKVDGQWRKAARCAGWQTAG